MKKEGIFVIATMFCIVLIVLLLPLTKIPKENEVSSFKECVNAGFPVEESFPRKCSTNKDTFVEKIENKIYCNESQRNVTACIQIYDPVCGFVNVECIKAPCNSVPQNFSNSCMACSNKRVNYYTKGECP